MKYITAVLAMTVLCSVQTISGQDTLRNRPFFVGAGFTYPLGPVFVVGAYHKSGWGAVLEARYTGTNAKNQPSDYSPGLVILGDGGLKDNVRFVSFRVLKLTPTEQKRIKFGLEGGLTLVQSVTLNNFKYDFNHGWLSENYTYSSDKKNTLGVSFRGKIEASLNSWSSLELGFSAILNQQNPYYGIDLTATIGSFQW